MCVHMDCAGCETKIRKALGRMKGVDEVEVDMARQKVTVTGWADRNKILRAVRKTGRRAVFWPYDSMDYHNNSSHNGSSGSSFNHYQYNPHSHPAIGSGSSSSSYNYYRHGYGQYSGSNYGYSSNRNGRGGSNAPSMFSDDNPNACSIM